MQTADGEVQCVYGWASTRTMHRIKYIFQEKGAQTIKRSASNEIFERKIC